MPVPVQEYRTLLFAAASITNGATTANGSYIDTRGYDYAIISVFASSAGATYIPSTCKLMEADVATNGLDANFADIVGARGGTDFTSPSAGTNAAAALFPRVQFRVPLQNRKRYIRCDYVPITTQTIFIDCQLLRADASPDSTAGPAATVILT